MILSWPGRLLLALASGLALALAFPSYNLALLAWVGVAGLVLASLGIPVRHAALLGFLHGVTFYGFMLPWVYSVMRQHGGLTSAAAGGVMALMVAVAALYPTVFSVCLAWAGREKAALGCLAAPFLWVSLELVRTEMPAIGFPWNLLGYGAAENMVWLQLAPLAGIYGLSFLVAIYNALLAWVLSTEPGRRPRLLAWLGVTAALVVVAHLGKGYVPTQHPRFVARLVQTNFPQSPSYPADWMDRHAPELDELERMSVTAEGSSPGLVIWPEVPAPFSLQDARFTARAQSVARGSRSHFLVGIVDWRPGAHAELAPRNSAALLDRSGRVVFLYDKIHLVPFGEYVPLRRWLSFVGKLTAEVGDFEPGSEYRVGQFAHGTFGVLICYEAAFPNQVRRFTAAGAGLLINLSNDGWFGRSAAPEQHLAMARVRAVENRRWLLRATNNGHTVAVDPYGRYAARLAPDVRGTLNAPYDVRSDLTPYTRWGDWLAWLCVATSVLLLAVTRPKAGRARRRSEAKG